MANQLIAELKYQQTEIDSLDGGDYIILYKGNVITVNTHDRRPENIHKAMDILRWLCQEFPGMKNTFFGEDGTPNPHIFPEGKEYHVFEAIANFDSMPRLLFGIVEDNGGIDGLELSFENDFNYDILRSPEMRQLASSGILYRFTSIEIDGEEYSPDELYELTFHRSGREGLPSLVYHGTTDKAAQTIVRKGLRPMKSNTRTSVINPSCVFLTSQFDVANDFARSIVTKEQNGTKRVVIEIDGDKLDLDKVVLDWDVANQYSTDIENSPYDNIQNPDQNPRFQGDQFKNSDRNADKSVRFGYKGIVMPSAIKAVYVYEGNRYKPYSVEEFIDDTHFMHEALTESIMNEVNAGEIDMKQFEPKKELNPKFWVNGKLNSRVRLRLLDIADDFMKELAIDWVKPEDIVFTGSLANYNWSKHSDIDLHIMVDYEKVYKKTDFVEDYFSSKKDLWADEHPKLKIYGYPVEVYVEDTHNDNPSSGIYSLEKNEWIVEPNDFQDAKINKKSIQNKAADFMTEIDRIANKMEKEDDEQRVGVLGKQMEKLFKKLRNLRVEGLASNGEMSSGNIIWKICRRMGYLDKLWKVINRAYDRVNSITESVVLNEAFGDIDSRGWLNIGVIKGYSPYMGNDQNTYLMVDPNAEQTEDLDNFRRFHTTFARHKEGGEYSVPVPQYHMQGLEIYPEYQDTYYGEVFLGRKKNTIEDQKKHEEFMSRLNIDGDSVILIHNSPTLITDGFISAGHEKQGYSRNGDVGIYFWGSKNVGSDPSNSGRYTYYCKVPLSSIYDFQTNQDRLTLKRAMSKYDYVAQNWQGGPAIVVTSWKKTPIWKYLDKSNGEIVGESKLNEGISNNVFHYCSMENLLKMIKNNKIYFNKFETENNKNGMKAFSTTRNRNSRQGYPHMQSGDSAYGGGTAYNGSSFPFYFIRIEFDGQSLTNLQYSYRGKHTTLKGEPYDYIYHFNKEENELGGYDILNSKEEIANMAQNGNIENDERYGQSFSQAEDRILSKKMSVEGFNKAVKRIDILLRKDKINDEITSGYEKVVVDFLKAVKWLMNSQPNVHVYDNRGYFDLQKGTELSFDDVSALMNEIKSSY